METIFNLYECTRITFILFLCASLATVIMSSLTNEKDQKKWQDLSQNQGQLSQMLQDHPVTSQSQSHGKNDV